MNIDIYRSADGSHAFVEHGKSDSLPDNGANWSLWRTREITQDDRVGGLDTGDMLASIQSDGYYITTQVLDLG